MIYRISYLLALCCLTPRLEASQWADVPVPIAKPPFISISIDSEAQTMFTVNQRSIQQSHMGKGWLQRFQVPAQTTINAMAQHGKTILLATNHGLYGSFDGGEHWQLIFRASGEAQAYGTSVAINPNNPQQAALGTLGGLFVSFDGGQHWIPSNSVESSGGVSYLAFDPQISGRLYALSPSALFSGDLSNNTWKKSQLAAASPTIIPAEADETVEADDEPATFELKTLGIDPLQPTHVYVGTTRGVMVSTDDGNTWSWLSNAGLRSADIARLAWLSKPTAALCAATTAGIACYNAASSSWKIITAGLSDGKAYDLAGSGDQLWAATEAGVLHYQAPADLFRDSASDPRELLSNFVYEPTVAQVRDAAIRYAEVHPDKIKNWRRQASLQAMLPSINFGWDRELSHDVHYDEGTFPNFQTVETEDQNAGFDFSVTWDLAELIWNNDQTSIDNRSKLMVQLRDDIISEVTRTYFERRRLQVALITSPPQNEQVLLEKELRVQELTALIDGLTGGYFSEQVSTPTNHGRL